MIHTKKIIAAISLATASVTGLTSNASSHDRYSHSTTTIKIGGYHTSHHTHSHHGSGHHGSGHHGSGHHRAGHHRSGHHSGHYDESVEIGFYSSDAGEIIAGAILGGILYEIFDDDDHQGRVIYRRHGHAKHYRPMRHGPRFKNYYAYKRHMHHMRAKYRSPKYGYYKGGKWKYRSKAHRIQERRAMARRIYKDGYKEGRRDGYVKGKRRAHAKSHYKTQKRVKKAYKQGRKDGHQFAQTKAPRGDRRVRSHKSKGYDNHARGKAYSKKSARPAYKEKAYKKKARKNKDKRNKRGNYD